MDILTHFRTIEELTKTLAREQSLLGEMFEKRKLMNYDDKALSPYLFQWDTQNRVKSRNTNANADSLEYG